MAESRGPDQRASALPREVLAWGPQVKQLQLTRATSSIRRVVHVGPWTLNQTQNKNPVHLAPRSVWFAAGNVSMFRILHWQLYGVNWQPNPLRTGIALLTSHHWSKLQN